ncbi:unnamed protein product [Caretta caretta]
MVGVQVRGGPRSVDGTEGGNERGDQLSPGEKLCPTDSGWAGHRHGEMLSAATETSIWDKRIGRVWFWLAWRYRSWTSPVWAWFRLAWGPPLLARFRLAWGPLRVGSVPLAWGHRAAEN